MNNKITLYDLLGLIKDGQAPRKIKYKEIIWEYDISVNMYFMSYTTKLGLIGYHRLDRNYYLCNCLNDEVEILDNEDEYIEKVSVQQIGWYERDKKDIVIDINTQITKLARTLNNLVREVNKLKKEGK